MRNPLIKLVLLVAFAAISLLPATAQQDAPTGQYDQQIQKDVSSELKENDKLQGIQASVQEGIVTLEGSVANYKDKYKAEQEARDADHVEGVRNRIQVTPEKRVSDEELRDRIAEKLAYDRIGFGIMFNHLTVDVKNGVVTVGGNVRDDSDKASAMAIVSEVPGVIDVNDEINVSGAGINDEARIRIARRVYGDPVLSKYQMYPYAPIRIIVEGNEVRLEGVVGSEGERRVAGIRAQEAAAQAGSFTVVNNLAVKKGGDNDKEMGKKR
jgi:hyperosmotically inducible periplasmic protein